MTVRTATPRPARTLLVLLAAVLVHTALGSILACHAAASERPVATVAADTTPVQQTATCPDCLPEAGTGAEAATTTPMTGDVPIPPTPSGPCTPDRPCQHGSGGGHAGGDTAIRGVDPSRDGGPPVVSASFGADQVKPPVPAESVSGPVPPAAVLTPVAVLCVNRN